jgi:predicted peptidase
MPQQPHTFEKQVVKTIRLNYLLYLPPDYDEGQKWPLLMFLHGSGERGDNVELVKKYGIPKLIDQGWQFPFIIASPQCPADSWWLAELDGLKALLDYLIENYPVDSRRVYLTGLSMGGHGAWEFGMAYPEYLAGLAPICGGGNPNRAHLLKDVPVWAFHGAKDTRVPLSESQRMVDALQSCGGNVKLTIYPDADHDSWTETYDNPELYEWFLNQQRP